MLVKIDVEQMHEVFKEQGGWKKREIEKLLLDGQIYSHETLALALRSNKPYEKLCKCLKRLFGDKKLSVVEVGVNEGKLISSLCKTIENVDVYAIEPNIDIIDDLKNKFSKNVKIFSHGLGENNGKGKLYVTRAARNSSQFMPNPDFSKLGKINIQKKNRGDFDVVKTIPFEILTGDNFVVNNDIKGIDLLSLNTQGSEFMIMKGFLNSFKSGLIKSVLLENDLDQRYLNANDDFVDQQVLLKKHGFNLFDIILIRNLGSVGIRRLYPLYVHESINTRVGF